MLEAIAQPLLKASHNKAFRYAAMIQHLNSHTPLPVIPVINLTFLRFFKVVGSFTYSFRGARGIT